MSVAMPVGVSFAAGSGKTDVEGPIAEVVGVELGGDCAGWDGSAVGAGVGAGGGGLAAGVGAGVGLGVGVCVAGTSVKTGSGAIRRGPIRTPERSSSGPCGACDGVGVGVASGKLKVFGVL